MIIYNKAVMDDTWWNRAGSLGSRREPGDKLIKNDNYLMPLKEDKYSDGKGRTRHKFKEPSSH